MDYRLRCLCAHRRTLQLRGGNVEKRFLRKFLKKVMVEFVSRTQVTKKKKMPCVTWEQPVQGLGEQ